VRPVPGSLCVVWIIRPRSEGSFRPIPDAGKRAIGIDNFAPALVFGFWSLGDFRRAGSMAEPLRLTQELVVSAGAALAWYLTGTPILGSMLALLSLVHHALVYLSGETLLKHEVR
jgi:hypothetical protein